MQALKEIFSFSSRRKNKTVKQCNYGKKNVKVNCIFEAFIYYLISDKIVLRNYV